MERLSVKRFELDPRNGYAGSPSWNITDSTRTYRDTGQNYPVGRVNYRQYLHGEAYHALIYTIFPSQLSLGGYPTLAEAVKAIQKAYDNQKTLVD